MTNRKIIAIDIDEVIADLMTVWLRRYNSDWDDNVQEKDIVEWDVANFVKPEAKLSIYDYCRNPEIYNFVKPVKDSQEVIKKLSIDYTIIYVTAAAANTADRKKCWLKENNFVNYHNFINTERKEFVCADFLVDDRYSNIKEFVNLYGINTRQGLLFTRAWNICVSDFSMLVSISRFDGWNKIGQYLNPSNV